MKRKRLYFDIETSYCIGKFWRPGYKLNISYLDIIKHAAIICICYKWEGERQTYSLRWDSKQCDKKMLSEFIKVANEADELIGHNGDKFDLAWIRTRCLFHRLPMFPTYTTIDTLKISRSKFKFPSNRLDAIASYLGIGHKIKSDAIWWDNIILRKCEASMMKMLRYCRKDVQLLQDVFTELSKHIEPKTHYGVINGKDRGSCPECGSKLLVFQRIRATATGLLRYRFKCKDCGKFHTKSEKQGKLIYEGNG